MGIETIKIKNFKGISSLEFNPKKINPIIGKNNTGKTSLVEAIKLLANPEEINQLYPDHITNIIKSGSIHSELIATINNKKIDLKIEKAEELETIYTFKNDLIEDLIKSLDIPEGSKDIVKSVRDELEKELTEYIDIKLKSTLIKDSILLLKDEKERKIYYNIKYPLYRPELSKLEEALEKVNHNLNKKLNLKSSKIAFRLPFTYVLFNLSRNRIKLQSSNEVFLIRNLVDNIKKIAPAKKDEKISERIHEIGNIIKDYGLISGLERLDFDYVILKNVDEVNHTVPFSFLGDGFKALVGFLWYFSSKDMNNKIVLLDEPEIHMHPGYILELIKFILKFSKDFNIQFFIVTHNRDLIEFLFSGNFSKEEQKYLEKELLVINMKKLNDSTISDKLDYKDARETITELSLDLRGV